MSNPSKVCSICKLTKSLDCYGPSGYRKDGTVRLRVYCKECNSKQAEVWRKNHLARDVLRVAMRRKIAKLATPPYITKELLLPLYEEARQTGMTVDHIIPLKHELVCGLNVPWNLQLLTKSQNSQKKNRYQIS